MASEVMLDPYNVNTWSPLEPNSGGKKTWEELRKGVRDTMKLLTSLGGSVPSSFTFRTSANSSGSVLSRLYFLGVPEKGRENTLLYVDITEDEHNKFVLQWMCLLDTLQPSWSSGQLSKEEQLMRERKRLGSYGITSYDYNESKGRFVFPANNSLYMCEDADLTSDVALVPTMIDTQTSGARLDPKICPVCPDIVAFINCNDIWVTCPDTNEEMRLTCTRSNSLSERLEDNPVTAGVPSFVMSEEFDRYTGYWWQPVVDCKPEEETRTLRILYEEVDESDVEVLQIFAPTSGENGGIEEHRYPRAGSPNAQSTLKVAQFQVNQLGPVDGSLTERQMVEPLSAYCPWAEYLIRAGWTPDGKFVYAQCMDRSQQRLCILLVPLECFVPEQNIDLLAYSRSNYPPVQCIYDESSPVWINVHDILHFFPQTFENEISFVWASQKTGYRHLFHLTSRLTPSHPPPTTDTDMDDLSVSVCEQCQVLREVQLTKGEWDVLARPIWVDEKRAVVYFMGTKDTPLETHLYAVSYAHLHDPVRLTEPGFSHSVSMNSDCTMYVTTYSSADTAPLSVVCKVEFDLQGVLSVSNCSTLLEPPVCPNYQSPELFGFQSVNGYQLYGMFCRPHHFRPGVRYPTVLFVYGGPQVQLVTNSFKGLKFLRLHTLAAHGYAVVMVDGRGSCNRGLEFEGCIKNRLGTVEMEDQVEGLQWLATNMDFIDPARVAIHGWSYGGYLALMGLAQRPDVFKLAVAGAPVVSWHLYDTGYTERYMALPCDNDAGYKQGSVLHYLHSFPDEENRLLIVHGLIDENVHFHHTSQLVTALVKACKPHRLQVYPNERHGIRSPESNEHYKTLVLSFLQDNL
ncbi:dipeptidyl peptidase 9-like isoform X2 [Littorina saxatilis]|uniref:dipeptidyl peptidase 9-like isoform X2 n=1 Tax=Littorina saxatilis TaxID=31220 RepID=UPI0038B59894